jgi:Single-strand binding protein family
MSALRRAPRAIPARAFSTAAPRSSFAKMTIIGRLADTPELQATSTGQEILRYAVGTNSGPRDNQKTSWFRVTSFLPEGPQRDFIASLDKGYVALLFNFSIHLVWGWEARG